MGDFCGKVVFSHLLLFFKFHRLLFPLLYFPDKHLLSICLIIHMDICFMYVHTDSMCMSQLILTVHCEVNATVLALRNEMSQDHLTPSFCDPFNDLCTYPSFFLYSELPLLSFPCYFIIFIV